jgi:hypothetical protein
VGKRSRKRGARPQATGHPLGGAGRPQGRSELRNAEARAKLAPLAPGERPTAVTVAAVVAFVIAVGNLAAYFAGFEINGQRPPFGAVALQALLMLVAAVGMWRARYWAVLGMQVLLGLLIVGVLVSAVTVKNLLGAVIVLAIVVPAGTLFWTLIKAMARIQMPTRP